MLEADDWARFMPSELLARLTDVRVADPQRASRAAIQRIRRGSIAPDGRLNLLAADHPARRITRVRSEKLAMCDRGAYLARCIRVLQAPSVDGIMGSMDVLEDLLIIDDLLR